MTAHSQNPGDETTRRPLPLASSDAAPWVTVLTVLSHPDPSRIGERAALPELNAGRTVELCRHGPSFAQPGSLDTRPLEDPFLSRRPWTLAATETGLELERQTSRLDLAIDGQAVSSTAFVPQGALETGVTLELADRVTLLLHRLRQNDFEAGEVYALPTKPERATAETQPMVGVSAAMVTVRRAIDRVADIDQTVLLRGESGTGKELVARALHRQSRRTSRPFVAVDLGVLSPSLAASTLFGHVKGAFTGASTAQPGFFRVADGGTLFLDEVGEATAEVQAMLLRVLETRQFVPVGSNAPVSVDVRLVAATDSDLEARVRRGDFKEPLLHRLAAYVIDLPPLRQRRDDIGRLLIHLARPVLQELNMATRLHPPSPDAPPWLPPRQVAQLARAPWTGNVRQLSNVVRQWVIDSRGEPQLHRHPRIESSRETDANRSSSPRQDASDGPSTALHISPPDAASISTLPNSRPRRPSDLTDDAVETAMKAHAFELSAAAKSLGVGRTSFYNLVRRHPTLRFAEDVPDAELRSVLDEYQGDVAATAQALEVSWRALGRRIARRSED